MTKILFVANTDWYLYNFRLSLAQSVQRRGSQLVLASPPGPYAIRFADMGLQWLPFPFPRDVKNLITEVRVLARWLAFYRKEQPDLVHHFTMKPVIYGSLVANMIGTKAIVNSVTGLGYLFTSPERRAKRLRRLVTPVCALALSTPRQRTIFQNADDRRTFVEQGCVKPDQCLLIPGSGVNPERFSPQPEQDGIPVILYAGRMLWDKGLGDLVEAGRLLRQQHVQVRVVLVGEPDAGNPSSIAQDQLKSWQAKGLVEWWGRQEDMPNIIAKAHVVVLPSLGEGLPRVLVEAAAMTKPLVATDLPGCRDIVYNGDNGFLVPPHDPGALADALAELIRDRSLRERMGKRGREIVLERFTDRVVNEATLRVYDSLLG